jgi:hypothetical protein
MTAIDALLLSDGRPGHFNLAEGVLAAAERLHPLTVTRMEVRRPRWLTPGMLWRLSSSRFSPTVILGYAYGIDAAELPPAKLVVSAGGDTLAANVAAARLLSAPNIFYGSLRRYRPEDFALVLTSYERNAVKPRHVMTLKPSRLDPGTLPRPVAGSGAKWPAVAGLLAGGDAGTVRFEAHDWSRLLAFVEATHRASGTRWVVSNSPRTPASFSDALARRAAVPNGPIREVIDVRSAGSGTLGGLFAAADAIMVTADSSSMLSEAVWARRPVISVSPEAMTLPADEQEYRRYLQRNGWTRPLAIAELTPERFLAELMSIRPLAENPLDHLASILAERLPGVLASPVR